MVIDDSSLIVLSGPPGAGKSTVGRVLAKRLGVEFTDTDELVEQRVGKDISHIFIDDGEEVFRAFERDVVAESLAQRTGVLSLGGGAILDAGTQASLRGRTVVFLDVSLRFAARRSGFDQGRPLLALNPRGQWLDLMKKRRPIYEALATVTVTTDGLEPHAVADAVVDQLRQAGAIVEPEAGAADSGTPTVIPVGPGSGPEAYDVVVGAAVEDQVAELLGGGDGADADPSLTAAERALVIHAEPVADLAARIGERLAVRGVEVHWAVMPDGEAAKTVEVAARLWSQMGAAGFTRSDVVVAVGGGAVTDLGGFVAASWLRGVPVVNVPTTVLGMVDAAVGGKTGINTPEGKNLVGAFHPPAGVVADLTSLRTLPRADLAAGLAEVVKGGFIADPRILEIVEADAAEALNSDSPVLRELVERKIAVKAQIVTGDLRESGSREFLNYGHTFAHAIENLEDYRWRHGDAVAVGMVFAAELARAAGVLDASVVDRHRRVLELLGLPVAYEAGRFDQALTVMRRDKKTRGSTLRFVVLRDVARPERLVGPSEELLREAYAAVTG